MRTRSSRSARLERDKGFATADASGTCASATARRGRRCCPMRAERRRPAVRGRSRRRATASSRADGKGRLVQWRLDNPHPGGHAQDPVRQGLVRGLLRARVRVAVHRRHRRLRGEVQPDPADLRHAQGHGLRAAHRGAAGAARRALRQRVHAPGGEELREAGGRDHGGAAERGARLPGRPLARADGRAHRPRPLPAAARAAAGDPRRLCRLAVRAARPARPVQDRDGGLPPRAGGARGRLGRLRARRPRGGDAARRQLSRLAARRRSGSPTTSATRWWWAWPWGSR